MACDGKPAEAFTEVFTEAFMRSTKHVSATEHENANPSPHQQNKHSGSGGVEQVESDNVTEHEKLKNM